MISHPGESTPPRPVSARQIPYSRTFQPNSTVARPEPIIPANIRPIEVFDLAARTQRGTIIGVRELVVAELDADIATPSQARVVRVDGAEGIAVVRVLRGVVFLLTVPVGVVVGRRGGPHRLLYHALVAFLAYGRGDDAEGPEVLPGGSGKVAAAEEEEGEDELHGDEVRMDLVLVCI